MRHAKIKQVVYAQTEEAFETAYSALKTKYADQPSLIEYLDQHKYPKRHGFVKAFTSRYRHFGHCVTSQGERGHSELKAYLQNNRHTLLDLKDRWVVMSRVFRVNYQKDLALARDRVYHDLNAKRWPDLLNPKLNQQIVPEATKLLVQQLHLMKDEVNQRPCRGSFERVNGIPCYHTLRTLRALKSTVGYEDFHPHWHFQRPVVSPADGAARYLPAPPPAPPGPAIFAPYKVVTRGRTHKDRSTRRDPSQFEVTAGITQPRPGRLGSEASN